MRYWFLFWHRPASQFGLACCPKGLNPILSRYCWSSWLEVLLPLVLQLCSNAWLHPVPFWPSILSLHCYLNQFILDLILVVMTGLNQVHPCATAIPGWPTEAISFWAHLLSSQMMFNSVILKWYILAPLDPSYFQPYYLTLNLTLILW